MWLLNCSNYRLEYNNLDSPSSKPYWILSHTWGDEEVTFQDMQNPSVAAQKKGFRKIEAMCKLALSSGWDHVWIDTCCIDKTSSAELSESINSMFYWYKKAARCIAFLEDLEPGNGIATKNELQRCRWFTRGWTLQELLAPDEVEFYDCQWQPRGTRRQLRVPLSDITRIDESILAYPHGPDDDELQMIPVATRMSWAAGRQTTRIEDKAYCLLGIFGVHMPLLYGERDQAFIRLQQTIAQKTNDMSLFAWIADPGDPFMQSSALYSGLLASDPSQFVGCAEIAHICDPLLPTPSWIINNAGIEMTIALDTGCDETSHTIITRAVDGSVTTELSDVFDSFCYRLFLHCHVPYPLTSQRSQEPEGLAILLRKTGSGFIRFRPTELCSVKRSDMYFDDPRPIRISTSLTKQQHYEALNFFTHYIGSGSIPSTLGIQWNVISCDAQMTFDYHPSHLWDRGQLSLTHSRFGSALRDDLAIGLIEVTFSNKPGSAPFSSTCWILCGMAMGSKPAKPAKPWIELAWEEADGSVALFRGHRCHRRELTNPYALASLLEQMQQQGLRLDADMSSGALLRGRPETSWPMPFGFWISNLQVVGDGEAYQVTISFHQPPPSGRPWRRQLPDDEPPDTEGIRQVGSPSLEGRPDQQYFAGCHM